MYARKPTQRNSRQQRNCTGHVWLCTLFLPPFALFRWCSAVTTGLAWHTAWHTGAVTRELDCIALVTKCPAGLHIHSCDKVPNTASARRHRLPIMRCATLSRLHWCWAHRRLLSLLHGAEARSQKWKPRHLTFLSSADVRQGTQPSAGGIA